MTQLAGFHIPDQFNEQQPNVKAIIMCVHQIKMKFHKGLETTTHLHGQHFAGFASQPSRFDLLNLVQTLISVVSSHRTQGLCQGRLRLDIRKRFFTERVFGHWNRLLREVVKASSLTELERRIDNALRHRA